jgi:GT2 family glycosyltransferase
VAGAVPEARLLVNARNLGFTAATRRGLEVAHGEYVLLLNADCELLPGSLPALVAFLDRSPAHAAAAPQLVDAEGATLRTCMNLPRLATALWHGTPLERWRPASRELRRYFARELDHERDADVEQPPGACLLVRRAVLERLGGLDPAMELYFSDVDLSRRLLDAGLRTRYLASARAVHAVGASTAQRPDRLLRWHADRLAYYRRHHGRAGAAWVKLCVLLAAADALARGELRAGTVLRPLLTLLAR